ncbi:MAG: SDR family oxidoreductase [Lachnospiraceae bacterium]|nr:SDR family oxidoreductase [Lachnospiraceae bacterium]
MENEKVLLVTGASSDVGLALIRKIGGNYKKIWAHYHGSKEGIAQLQKTFGEVIVPIQADFSSEESTDAMIGTIENSGDLPDHVVHLSAPKARNLQFHKTSWADYQRELDTSLRSVTKILQAFLPKMAKKKQGKVVFMLTAYTLGVPPKFQSIYVTSKYALLGLMKSLSAEYAGKGITVNGVSPEMMETKFLSDLPELIIEQNAQSSPLGRNLSVEDVVPAFEYLLSDAADAVTGQNLGITGGMR